MSIVYDGNFGTADANGGPSISQDFPDTTEVTSFLAPIMQRAASYAPLTLTASTSYLGATWYHTGDRGFANLGGDVLSFQREFAKIPAQRIVPGGTYAYTFPGMTSFVSSSIKTITAATFAGTTATFTATAHGLEVGDIVLVKFNVSITAISASIRQFYQTFTQVRTVPTANSFSIRFPSAASVFFFHSGTAQEYVPARNPRTIPASTIIQYDYALPGVTSEVSSALDFNAFPEFRVVGESGEGSVENVLSATTSPTLSAYLTSMSNGDLITIESGVAVWRGGILERRTVFVRAQ
jgi:hypothetical protein